MKTYVVTGCASGLGLIISQYLINEGKRVIGLDRNQPPSAMYVALAGFMQVELLDFYQIQDACREMLRGDDVECLVNCAGTSAIDYLENVRIQDYERVMAVNVRAPLLLTQGLLPALIRNKGTVLNIISNASHMPMTASAAYNASKGALHIMTLQLARELTKRHGITVFGISPNKLEGTGMSAFIEERVPEVRGWTPEQARAYQLNALVTGKETPPEYLAEFAVWLLSEKSRHEYLSGCVLPYGA